MKLHTKIQLSRLSIWIIIATLVIVCLFFFGFILANAFELRVFNNRTSDFIWTLFAASLVIVFCGAFLNISLNIGIIADSHVSGKENVQERRRVTRKIVIVIFLLFALVVPLMFGGDWLTRQNERRKLIAQCEDILVRYDKIVNDIASALKDKEKIGEIPDMLTFLSNQKTEFPSLLIITSAMYKEALTFLQITNFSDENSLQKPLFDQNIYSCSEYDCDYLDRIFTNGDTDYLFWSKQGEYRLYYPFDRKGVKFILLFSKQNRFGKVGS